jgi:hypothetical protein
MGDDGMGRTGLYAVMAFRAPLEKKLFFRRTGRTQPLQPNLSRGLFLSEAICLLDKRLRGFDRGENGIFQKISPTV